MNFYLFLFNLKNVLSSNKELMHQYYVLVDIFLCIINKIEASQAFILDIILYKLKPCNYLSMRTNFIFKIFNF